MQILYHLWYVSLHVWHVWHVCACVFRERKRETASERPSERLWEKIEEKHISWEAEIVPSDIMFIRSHILHKNRRTRLSPQRMRALWLHQWPCESASLTTSNLYWYIVWRIKKRGQNMSVCMCVGYKMYTFYSQSLLQRPDLSEWVRISRGS